MHGAGNPAMCVQGNEDIIDEAGDILPGRYAGDWPGQDVIEHEGGDAHFGQGSAQSFLHNPVHATPDKHRAALGGTLAKMRDRKSTRLNSSHGYISYAAF